MGAKQGRGHIFIGTDNSTVIAGQVINCTAHLLLNDKIKSPNIEIAFIGKEQASFQGDGLKRGKNIIIQFSQSLLEKNLRVLETGAYSFPFSLQIPVDIPGSFKASMKRFEASIEYSVKVELKEGRELICKNKALVTVEQAIDSGRHSILKTHVEGIVCCDCVNKGRCGITAHVDKHAYLPEESAKLWIDVDNSKSNRNLNAVGVMLWRVIRLISNDREVGLFKKCIFSNNIKVKIPAKRNSLTNKEICIEIPISNKDSDIEQCVTTIGKTVQCRYFIEVSTDFGRCMSRVVEFEIPLIVAPKAIHVALPSAPEDWSPIEMPRSSLFVTSQNASIIDRSSLTFN